MSLRTLTGIHHITAIASDPQRNVDFYTRVLGLRLVKLTVNFDDPGSYHLYFGNHAGAPGSVLTFFLWPGVERGQVGNGQVSAIAFAISRGTKAFWMERLESHGVPTRDGGVRFGEPVLLFADPDGLPLELIETDTAERGIAQFHSATLSEEGYERTAGLFQGPMGWEAAGSEGNRFRYRPAPGGATAIDVTCTPDARRGRLGGGTAHHIAYRTPDDNQQAGWRAELARLGFNVSPIMDRRYFHSIYFREPGGVLFEIATDPPGFALDEDPAHLGEHLMLPPWLERHRAMIEAALPPLTPNRAGE